MNELLPFFLPPLARGSVVPSLRTTPRRARLGGVSGEDRGDDHQGEAPGADPHRGVDAHEHQGQAGDDADGPDQPSPPLQRGQGAALHLRGELGVLGSKSLLHLFEHLLLVL